MMPIRFRGYFILVIAVIAWSASDGLAMPAVPKLGNNEKVNTKFSIAPDEIPKQNLNLDRSDDCIRSEKNLDQLNQNQFLKALTKDCRYDKLSEPVKDQPLTVTLHMEIRHIELSTPQSIKLETIIQYHYMDHRLNFENLSSRTQPLIGRDGSLANDIWIPHIVLANARDNKVMGLQNNDVFVMISPQGKVTYGFRASILLYCRMNFKKFPFDKQTCTMRFQSWLFNASVIDLRWEENNKSAIISDQVHLDGFQLEGFWSNYTMGPSLVTEEFGGNCSTLLFTFKVAREMGHYMLDYFLPSILLVMTSWLTFWLQADAGPPRTTLGTATMLSLITLSSGQTKSLPKVSYIKISEIWFFGCALFIFASLVEFAFVNMIFRRRKNCELKKVNSKYVFKCTFTPSLARNELYRSFSSLNSEMVCPNGAALQNAILATTSTAESADNSRNSITGSSTNLDNCQSKPWTTMSPKDVANWIDTRCRIAFPIAFLIFNLFFWSYTLSVAYF